MIVPVDRRLHSPQGFHFSGQWKCGADASIASIEVGNQNRATGGATLRLSGPWTEIRESQDGFDGNYFVGYDRDKSQFLRSRNLFRLGHRVVLVKSWSDTT